MRVADQKLVDYLILQYHDISESTLMSSAKHTAYRCGLGGANIMAWVRWMQRLKSPCVSGFPAPPLLL